MAKRYCGGVTITIAWIDRKECYRGLVSCAESTMTIWVKRPNTQPHAVDSSTAYDLAARAALSFAIDGSNDSLPAVHDAAVAIADAAASGVHEGNYVISRQKPS